MKSHNTFYKTNWSLPALGGTATYHYSTFGLFPLGNYARSPVGTHTYFSVLTHLHRKILSFRDRCHKAHTRHRSVNDLVIL